MKLFIDGRNNVIAVDMIQVLGKIEYETGGVYRDNTTVKYTIFAKAKASVLGRQDDVEIRLTKCMDTEDTIGKNIFKDSITKEDIDKHEELLRQIAEAKYKSLLSLWESVTIEYPH